MTQRAHNAYERFVAAHPFWHLFIVGILAVSAIGIIGGMGIISALGGAPDASSSSFFLYMGRALLPLNAMLILLGVIGIILKARSGDALFFGALLLLAVQMVGWSL